MNKYIIGTFATGQACSFQKIQGLPAAMNGSYIVDSWFFPVGSFATGMMERER